MFGIADNPIEDGSAPLWRIPVLGWRAVQRYGAIAEEEAKRLGLDPDLVKAVLYYENADGHWGVLNDLGDLLGTSKTVMPMNINPGKWGGLGISRETARDPRTNIRAAVKLLKRIAERIEDPTPEKIGSLWNGMMLEKVNDRGARIGRIYRERPWEQIPPDTSDGPIRTGGMDPRGARRR